MNCDNIDKLISAYIDRELKGDLEPKVRYHLAYCGRCFKAYSEMKKTKELLSSLKSHELPDGFWKDTRARFRPQAVRSAAVPRRRSSRVWTALAAAACLLVTASMVSLAPNPPLETRLQTDVSSGITAAMPEVKSLVNWSGPIGSSALMGPASYQPGSRANTQNIEVMYARDSSSHISVLDLNNILRFDDPDPKEYSESSPAGDGQGVSSAGRGSQAVRSYYGSPTLVPAGWSGGQ